MRRFRDTSGRQWDVLLGRESWGANVALFVPVDDSAVRQTVLTAVAVEDAQQELDALDEAGLQALLDRSAEKEA